MTAADDYSGSLIVICVCLAGVIALGVWAAARDAAIGIRYWTPERTRLLAACGLAAVIYASFVALASWMDPGPAVMRFEQPERRLEAQG